MTRTRDACLLGAALALSIAGGLGRMTLPLDLENASMKAEGTAAAAAAEVRAQEFGASQTLLALLESRDGRSSAAADAPPVSRWLEGARALPGVLRCDVLPISGPDDTLVAFEIARGADADGALARKLEHTLPLGRRLSITGASVGEHAIARALSEEERRIVPLILAAFAVLLFSVYRSIGLVVAGLLPGLGAILWTGGLQYLLGLSIDPVASLVAPVILTIGVAGAVHLIERHRTLVEEGVPPSAAPGQALRSLMRPTVFTALTTAAGFVSLTPSSIPAVRRFAWISVLGVALTLLWTLALVPSWLRLFGAHVVPRPGRRTGDRARRHVRHVRGAAPWLVAASALGGLWLGWRGLSIRVDTDPSRILPADHPFRVETARITARLGASETFELLVPPLDEARLASGARTLLDAVGSEPLVESLAGIPKRSPHGWVLASLLLWPSGTSERARLFERVEEQAERAGLSGARACGDAVQVAQDSEALVHEQQRGFLATIVLLWVALGVALRSWRLGLLGLIPNVLPCVVLQGALALADRPLSVATAMIATVLLGLIVDDTIHFLHGYRAERGAGRSTTAALEHALEHSGRAIVVTSAVLTLGFAAGLVGRLTTTIEFAALCSLTILLALACDLVLLPALLLLPELRLGRRARSWWTSRIPRRSRDADAASRKL